VGLGGSLIMGAYGARTGVTSLLKFVKILCRIYIRWQEHIVPWVVASVPPEHQTTVLAWLAAIPVICGILSLTPDD
jgi:hypothetical protein